jgi:hypothetical protein
MEHTCVKAIGFCAIGLIAGVLLRAQEPIHYTAGSAATAPNDPTRPDNLFRDAEAKIAQEAFDTAAETLLRGIEAYTKNVFNVPSLRLRKAATERVLSDPQRGDYLIAEWVIQETFGSGLMVLTDTPYYSTYELRLSGVRIVTEADLTAFLHALLAWHGSQTTTPTIFPPPTTISVGVTPITFFAGQRFGISQFNFIADFHFSGLVQGGEWLIGFRLGKSGTEKFYGVPPWIPERFPPLTELVKSWGPAKTGEAI